MNTKQLNVCPKFNNDNELNKLNNVSNVNIFTFLFTCHVMFMLGSANWIVKVRNERNEVVCVIIALQVHWFCLIPCNVCLLY